MVRISLKLKQIPRLYTEFDENLDMPEASSRSELVLYLDHKNEFELFVLNNIISDIDLIVNTTSLGMKDNHNIEIDFDKSKTNLHVYDLIYNPQQTKLLIDAEMSGCTYQNGLDILVHQAAESFFIWHGIYPTINEEIFSIIRELK